jgi:hypothetical protein
MVEHVGNPTLRRLRQDREFEDSLRLYYNMLSQKKRVNLIT